MGLYHTFHKVLVGNLGFHCLQTFQPKIFGSELENRNSYTFHKSPWLET